MQFSELVHEQLVGMYLCGCGQMFVHTPMLRLLFQYYAGSTSDIYYITSNTHKGSSPRSTLQSACYSIHAVSLLINESLPLQL